MKFHVSGADGKTGQERVIELDAPNAAEAEANRRGLLVEAVRPVNAVRVAAKTRLDYQSPLAARSQAAPALALALADNGREQV